MLFQQWYWLKCDNPRSGMMQFLVTILVIVLIYATGQANVVNIQYLPQRILLLTLARNEQDNTCPKNAHIV